MYFFKKLNSNNKYIYEFLNFFEKNDNIFSFEKNVNISNNIKDSFIEIISIRRNFIQSNISHCLQSLLYINFPFSCYLFD